MYVERDGRDTAITVMDQGVGIPDRMREAYPEESNHSAVRLALTVGKSTSGQDWRGFGLDSLVRLAARPRFSAYLDSGDVAVWIEDGHLDFAGKSGGTPKGTLVRVVHSA